MLDQLIGEHPALRNVKLQLPTLAQSCDALLVVGEPGVGKSLVTAHIHSRSPFAHNKLITIDCSLLKDRDQRVMLFGGDMSEFSTTHRSPLELQTTVIVKHPECVYKNYQHQLARTIQSGFITRTGSQKRIPIQCRIVFFLHSRLPSLQRADRLDPLLRGLLENCRKITLPPLRKRRCDIPILAKHFIQEVKRGDCCALSGVAKNGTPSKTLLRILAQERWAENVAGLEAFIHCLAIRSPKTIINDHEYRQLRRAILNIDGGKPSSLKAHLSSIRTSLTKRAVTHEQGNQVRAARILGLTEFSVRRQLISDH